VSDTWSWLRGTVGNRRRQPCAARFVAFRLLRRHGVRHRAVAPPDRSSSPRF